MIEKRPFHTRPEMNYWLKYNWSKIFLENIEKYIFFLISGDE